ncbi:MAG: ABC transporter permease [Tannerellaceae bacterium]|jgi:putative ABC transport system permease protein|nr:ABC transporter permease [Tannerellaceae bacterium]
MFDIDRWQEIWITITRNKTRSLLTGFGVFWGILMLVILLGAGNGFKNGIFKNVEGFSTNSAFFFSERTGEPYKGYKKGRYWQMRNRDLETIRARVQGVRYISPMVMQWSGSNNVVRGIKAGTYNIRGIYSDYFNIETQHLPAGRLLNEIDMREHRKVCVIGDIVRDVLFDADEDPIGQYIRVSGIYYQVVGVVKPKARVQIGGRTSESVMVPYTTLQQAANLGDKFWFLCATANDGYPADRMVEDIKDVLRSQNEISPTDEQAVSSFTIAKQFETFNMLFMGINFLVWLVGMGTLLAGVIGVSNIMMVTVRERTNEIGVRRALGAKPLNIISQIMSESLLLTVIAGMMGLCLGVFALDLVGRAMAAGAAEANANANANGSFFDVPEIHIGTAVIATVVLLISGLFAGLIPAWRAMQIKAIDAIREE